MECQPIASESHSKFSDEHPPWAEAYPWAVAIIVVLGLLIVILVMGAFYLYTGTEMFQKINNLKKRMKGLPKSGPMTAVVTDIEGWTGELPGNQLL